MKQKRQIIVLVVLLMIATAIWYSRSKNPGVITDTTAFLQSYSPLAVDNPQLHWWKLADSRKAEYKSNGRNIFSSVAPLAPAAAAAQMNHVDPVAPPVQQAPPPPALPVKFFGYGTVPAGSGRRAFFTDGEDIWIVGEGETLLGRYRIIKIGNASLEFEEISSGRRASALLEDQGQGPGA